MLWYLCMYVPSAQLLSTAHCLRAFPLAGQCRLGHIYERQEVSCNNFRMRGSSRLTWVDLSEW